MSEPSVPQAFAAALDGLIRQAEKDSSILAAMLCGSLSHDVVWDKSDIDLLFVTVDDHKLPTADLPLYADGVNVHALLVPRAEFRKMVDGTLHHSFVHSFLAEGRLLYTNDETIEAMRAACSRRGQRDTAILMLRVASDALRAIYKARKWLVTRGDLDYTSSWTLYAATSLAHIEVIGAESCAGPRSHSAGGSAQPVVDEDHLRRSAP